MTDEDPRARLAARIAQNRTLLRQLLLSVQELQYEVEDNNYRLGRMDERRQRRG